MDGQGDEEIATEAARNGGILLCGTFARFFGENVICDRKYWHAPYIARCPQRS